MLFLWEKGRISWPRNIENAGGIPCDLCTSGETQKHRGEPLRCLRFWPRNSKPRPSRNLFGGVSFTGSRGPHGPPARLPQALYIGSRYFVSREAGWAGWASCMGASAPCPSGCTGQFLGLHPAMYRWPAAIRSGITKYLKTGPEHSSNNPEQKTTTSKHTCRIFSP